MSREEVIKSSFVIHISHELSLVQQQLWNILLNQAYNNLGKQTIHYVDVRILFYYLGKSRSILYLQNILDQLCTIESYNLINKTSQQCNRNKFKLLSSAAIEDSICRYSFSNDIIPQLINPHAYAKINLLMQRKFKSKYSLIIYELCKDYLHIERTRTFTLDGFKTYLGITPHEYTMFKHLNYKIIKKAISEINQKADLSIAVKFDVKKGQDILWFTIKKKTRTSITVQKVLRNMIKKIPKPSIEQCPFMQLKDHGISDQKAKRIVSIFSPQEIQKVIQEVHSNLEQINLAALITKIFNIKEKGRSQSIKVMSAKKTECSNDKQKLMQEHSKFVENQINALWEQLPDDRKQSLDAAFDQWIMKQGVCPNFVIRPLVRPVFLKQVLLMPKERDFDEWVKARNTKNCNSL